MSDLKPSYVWFVVGPLLGVVLSLMVLSFANLLPKATSPVPIEEAAILTRSEASISRQELLKSLFEEERLQLGSKIELLKKRLASLEEEQVQRTLQETQNTNPYIEELKRQKAVARSEAADAAAQFSNSQTVLQSGDINSLPSALKSSFIQEMKEEYYSLIRKEAALSTHLGDRHPDMIGVRSEISKIKSQLSDELMDLISSARYQKEVSLAKEEELEKALEEAKRETSRTLLSQLKIDDLEEDLKKTQNLYQALLDKTQQLAKVEEPFPSRPKDIPSSLLNNQNFLLTLMIISLGLLAGWGFSSLSGVWLGKIPQVSKEKTQPHGDPRVTNMDLRAVLPHIEASSLVKKGFASLRGKRDQFRVIIDSLLSPDTAQELTYRMRVCDLAQSVWQSAQSKKPYITGVSSIKSGSGASSVSLALAVSTAKEEKKTLLVDASSRGHSLSKHFRIFPDPELAVIFDSKEDLIKMTSFDTETNIFFLPIALADIPSLRPSQLRRLVRGLQDLATSFDVMFLDMGSLLEDEVVRTFVGITNEILIVSLPQALNSRTRSEIAGLLSENAQPYSIIENKAL